MNVYYFAYGSNMSIERLRDRIGWLGPIKKKGVYRLKGFRMAFTASGFANIENGEKDDLVEGVVYEISKKQLNCLDWYEGNYDRFYHKTSSGEKYYLYIASPRFHRYLSPTTEYLKLILKGAEENGLDRVVHRVGRLLYERKIIINEHNY